MTTATHAPSGGLVSNINGQFYNGGEFMPLSGLFCGKKGEKRLAKWEKAVKQNKAKDLGGSKLFELCEYAGNGAWEILGYAIADDKNDAIAAFTAKTKIYANLV
jgi:hypothetical protein